MKKIINIILAIICAAAVAAVGYYFSKLDRKGPEITIPNTRIRYKEGTDYEQLLENVTAQDDVDGDVTDSIVVEAVYSDGADNAVAVYVARDSSNNITKVKRTVQYIAAPQTQTVDEESDDE